ncbi:MAG: FecR domain-containing protein [Verrucomicrobia bacterium]|nr:FecR domain-containing protein [Verrucomicrobiota bacterium]
MKECARISKLIACVAVLVGVVAMTSAQAAQSGKAVVRSVSGEAQYSDGGAWLPLSAGKELMPGSAVRTANDSKVVLFLDQNGPLVMLTENTTLGIDKLSFEPTGVDTIIETQLDLKSGRIVGIAKKLSATSKYEVKTPSGVAGIRGTEYSISATGEVYVLDGSVVVVSVRPDGSVVTQVVSAGEMFNPASGRVQPIPSATQDELLSEVNSMKAAAPPTITVDGEPIIFVSPTTGLGSE